VFAFKDERPATFNMFTMLIFRSSPMNVKEFELLQGNESPTGFFQSIGTFKTQNVKLFKTPYQEFTFSPVTAKYLKVKILSGWEGITDVWVYQFQLLAVSLIFSCLLGREWRSSSEFCNEERRIVEKVLRPVHPVRATSIYKAMTN
jgi:hypothetical protein